MIWYCHDCGTVLRVWTIKCTNCRRAAVNWLHVVVFAALALTAIFLVLRTF